MAGGRGSETRARLIDAARSLIAESGWRGATTRAVAARAGVNSALIHYHFGSKEALLIEAVAAALADTLSAPAEALAGGGDPAEGIHTLMASLRDLDAASADMLVFSEALVRASRDETLRTWMAEAVRRFRELVERSLRDARARGYLSPDLDVGGGALIVTALLDGLVLHRLLDPDLDLDRAADALVALLRGPDDPPTPRDPSGREPHDVPTGGTDPRKEIVDG